MFQKGKTLSADNASYRTATGPWPMAVPTKNRGTSGGNLTFSFSREAVSAINGRIIMATGTAGSIRAATISHLLQLAPGKIISVNIDGFPEQLIREYGFVSREDINNIKTHVPAATH